MIDNIILGINVVFSSQGIFFLISGCILGTLVGVLPGLGTVATLAILFPFTYDLSPVYSLIMMAGIYYGAQYGGSTTSILINTPGEISSVMTCVDGYPLTKKGEGGKAVVSVGIASFIAGIITIFVIGLLSPLVSEFAYKFGSKELSLLMLLGLVSISIITNKNPVAGIGVACIGILLGTIGTDINSGVIRFSGDAIYLVDGISIPVLAIGIFGLAEIFKNISDKTLHQKTTSFKINFKLEDFIKILPSSIRGTFVGSFFGLIPGGGTIMSTFAAYALEKKISNNKEEFGNGSIAGVTAPEAANNAAAQTGFIPLLTLGIPENAVMALILGVLVVAGIQPGPGMIEEQAPLFWGLLVSMVLGNFFLIILNIPLVKIWLKILNTPKITLYPILLTICLFGVYSINNSLADIGLAILFGIFGLILMKLDLEPAPLMFGFVIGKMFEEYSRRALTISNGNFGYFLEGSISKSLLCIIIFVLFYGIYRFITANNSS